MRSILNFSILILFLLSCSSHSPVSVYRETASKAGDKVWDQASNGQHSYRAMGEDFYVPMQMKQVDGARMVLFNYDVAKKLGLELPSDPEELEKLILDRFAVMVDTEGKGDREMFATRYLDSGQKAPGEALGDGRAAWAGAMTIQNSENKPQEIDFVLKGIGQTPLAWTNHNDVGHKDGLQTMNEAVHSFMMSQINAKNNLDTTVDLAVIELPLEKVDKHTGKKTKVAVTVRVGGQTRMAHLRYFADNKKQFQTIFEYIVRRELGMKANATVSENHVEQYIEKFVKNIADEAARYFDLNAVHSSPTPGNRTTLGSTIDLGTFRYLDAHHKEYTYLFDQLKLADQTTQLSDYINDMFYYMSDANYKLNPGSKGKKRAFDLFGRHFQEVLTNVWLRRVGLSDEEIAKLQNKKKAAFFHALYEVYDLQGKSKVKIERREFKPAGLDARKIVAGTMEALSYKGKDQKDKITDLFTNERKWATLGPESFGTVKNNYLAAVQDIVNDLSNGVIKEEWVSRAKIVGDKVRLEPGRDFYKLYEEPVLELIHDNKNFREITARTFDGIESLVDQGLPARAVNNLGTNPRVGVFSGTFSPPHLSHVKLIQQIKDAYNLDKVYIIPNVTSEHKSDVLDYGHRKEMTRLAFSEIPGTEVAPKELEAAFKKQDMTGVLSVISKQNPKAELFQIMGDDSFERYKKVLDKGIEDDVNKTLIVVKRDQATEDIERIVNKTTVSYFKGNYDVLSSTAIRKELEMKGFSSKIPAKVSEYINQKKLFSPKGINSGKCVDLIKDFVLAAP